jgi:nucleotide-binding universal stress UspA family protein
MTDIKLKKIMVALAMNGDEERVIGKAVEISEGFGSSLIVVHVNDIHAGKMSMMMDSPPKFTAEDIRQRFIDHGFEETAKMIEIQIIESESPAKAIGEAAKNIDLLVLGHRPQSTFKMNFFDSVDEGIINHVSCPVLVVPKV